MITVTISINGEPIYTRTAVRTKDRKGFSEYVCDDNTTIKHKPNDGAVKLAKLMLSTIHEVKK